jgi:multicomponent Na+:H+ antiporter subunit B
MAVFALVFCLLVIGLLLIQARDLFVTGVLLGVFSVLMMLFFAYWAASDVALTEAAIGVALFLWMWCSVLPSFGDAAIPRAKNRVVASLTSLFMLVILVPIFWLMPHYGDPFSAVNTHVGAYVLEHGKAHTGVANQVTVLLASYRALDTLGEVMVLLLASYVVFMILSSPRRPHS